MHFEPKKCQKMTEKCMVKIPKKDPQKLALILIIIILAISTQNTHTHGCNAKNLKLIKFRNKKPQAKSLAIWKPGPRRARRPGRNHGTARRGDLNPKGP